MSETGADRTAPAAGRVLFSTTSRVLFIDDARATAASTARRVGHLRSAGLDAVALSTRPIGAREPRSLGGRGAERFPGSDPIDPVIPIGAGSGADLVYRLLSGGKARAAVLLDPVFVPARHDHGPVLLISTAPSAADVADELRSDGICDQHTPGPVPAGPAAGEWDADLAHYIRGWLDFHRLLTRQGD